MATRAMNIFGRIIPPENLHLQNFKPPHCDNQLTVHHRQHIKTRRGRSNAFGQCASADYADWFAARFDGEIKRIMHMAGQDGGDPGLCKCRQGLFAASGGGGAMGVRFDQRVVAGDKPQCGAGI